MRGAASDMAVGYHTARRARHSRVGGIVADAAATVRLRAVVCPSAAAEHRRDRGTDGDRNRPARGRGATGRSGGGRGDRVPRVRHGPSPAGDARRHDRALHRLRRARSSSASSSRCSARWRSTSPRCALVLVANAFPIMTMSLGGPEQRRHDPGQRQGTLRRRHVAAGDRRGPGRRGHAAGQDPRHAGDPAARCISACARPGSSRAFAGSSGCSPGR